jgi:FtsZ-binding cell division protein ZapB
MTTIAEQNSRSNAELNHVTSLLGYTTQSLEELKERLRRLAKTLKQSKQKHAYECARANALETRLEELAQLLQLVTDDRDNLRAECIREGETIRFQTQEREDQQLKHTAAMGERNDTIHQLQMEINELKNNNNELQNALQSEKVINTQLTRDSKVANSELAKAREKLAQETGKVEISEQKLAAIFNVLKGNTET